MSGNPSSANRAHPPGSRGWRVVHSLGTAVFALGAALVSPQVESGPYDIQLALAVPVAAQLDARALAPRLADFGSHRASAEARHVADWVADSRDNGGTEFVIIDKPFARVYVFDANARLRGTSPVLLGAARGDESVPGIGTRPIADVLPLSAPHRPGASLPNAATTPTAKTSSGSTTTPPCRCTACAPPIPRSAVCSGWPRRR